MSDDGVATPVGDWSMVMVDCADPERLATFWSAMLGVERAGSWEQYEGLRATAKGAPRLAFQRVAEPKQGKNRLHVDLDVADLDAATERALSLGASVVADVEQQGMRWRTMADPEGNEFCLCLSMH